MTRQTAAESTELQPLPVNDGRKDEDQSASSTTELEPIASQAKLQQGIWRRIVAMRWREIVTASIIMMNMFLICASISLIGIFFPIEANLKGVSLFTTGIIVGVTPLAETIFAPFIGYLLPILRIPFSIVTGLILVGGVYIGLGLAIYLPSGWPFIFVCIALRFIEGVGTALFNTAGNTLITQLFPESMGLLVGISRVGSGVGYACGPVIGGLLYKAGGYRLPFFSIGGLYFVFAVPVFFILIIFKTSQKSTRRLLKIKVVLSLLKNFSIFLVVLGVVLQMVGFGFQVATYSFFLGRQFSLTPDKIGFVFIANAISYATTSPVIGLLSDRINPRYVIISGLLTSGLGCFLIGPTSLIPVHPALWLSIVGDVLMSAGAGQTIVPAFSDISNVVLANFPELLDSESSDSQREKIMGIVAGMISAGLSFGEFVGPIVGGGLTDLFNFRMTATIFGEALLALMALLAVVSVIDHCLTASSRTPKNEDSCQSTIH